MSNLMEWKTAEEVIEIAKTYNNMIDSGTVGFTMNEIAESFKFVRTSSGQYVKLVTDTVASSPTASTAVAAATGVTTGAVTTAANLVLYEGAGGAVTVGGLASVVAPVAATMAAATGGYLIGKKIGEENDEFFSKLLYPVFDFFTGQNIADSLYNPVEYTVDRSPTVPIIFDHNGRTFMDSRLKLKIKDLLESMSSGIGFKEITHPLFNGSATIYNLKAGQVLKYHTTKHKTIQDLFSEINITVEGDGEPYIAFTNNLPETIFFSNAISRRPFKLVYNFTPAGSLSLNSKSITVNGVELHYVVLELNYNNMSTMILNSYIKSTTLTNRGSRMYNEDLYVLLNAEGSTTSLPSGVTKYVPKPSTTPPLTFPDEIPSWEEVTLPDLPTEPGTMPEPKEYPDPTPSPEKITPYINPIQPQPKGVPLKVADPATVPAFPVVPFPNPFPIISPNPVPTPDPAKDPSISTPPEPAPSPEQVPTKTPAPSNTGTTPKPLLPVVPPISSTASGLLHVYNPTNEQINSFGSWLWTTFSGDLMDTLSKLFNNPMDAVIGLHEIYCTPTTGSETTIKAGFLDSGVASRLVTSRYVTINCGAMGVPEYWHNYLDYSPYTKSYCYLPFIGIVELNTDDIVGSGVEISYKIDTYNGSCIAMITTAKSGSPESITYQFSGNCAVEVPITSGMKTATQGALLGAAVAGLSAATGGMATVGAVIGRTAVGGARGASNSKNSVQHSGSFGSSYGAMGLKKPYLIIKRPRQKVVPGYNTNYGYPAHKMVHIAKCKGYLKALEVDVVSPTATEDEKKLIEQQLKSGIFVD